MDGSVAWVQAVRQLKAIEVESSEKEEDRTGQDPDSRPRVAPPLKAAVFPFGFCDIERTCYFVA